MASFDGGTPGEIFILDTFSGVWLEASGCVWRLLGLCGGFGFKRGVAYDIYRSGGGPIKVTVYKLPDGL